MSKRSKSRIPLILKLINYWPPYLGTGIWVKSYNKDINRIEVIMKKTFYNSNAYGTHYGGSLFSMTDPFYAFIIHHFLGRDYIIWDQSASIKFLKPGTGTVSCVFEVTPERLAEIKKEVDENGKGSFHFDCEITIDNIFVRKYLRKLTEISSNTTMQELNATIEKDIC